MLSAVFTQVEADTSVWSVSAKHTHNTLHTKSWFKHKAASIELFPFFPVRKEKSTYYLETS